MTKVAIIINDGGLVEQIISDDPTIEVMTVNYDLDGYEGNDVLTLDSDGPAQVNLWAVSSDESSLEFLNAGIEEAKKLDL
jgi:hypothetical protein